MFDMLPVFWFKCVVLFATFVFKINKMNEMVCKLAFGGLLAIMVLFGIFSRRFDINCARTFPRKLCLTKVLFRRGQAIRQQYIAKHNF